MARLCVNRVQTGVQTVEILGVFVQTVQTIEKDFFLRKENFLFMDCTVCTKSPKVSNGLYNGLYTVCTFLVGKEDTGTTHAFSTAWGAV